MEWVNEIFARHNAGRKRVYKVHFPHEVADQEDERRRKQGRMGRMIL